MTLGATLAAAVCLVAAAQRRGWTRRWVRSARRWFGGDLPYVLGWLGAVLAAVGVADATALSAGLIGVGALLVVFAAHERDRAARREAERVALAAAAAAAEDAVAGEVAKLGRGFGEVAARVDRLAGDVDALLDDPAS